MYKTECKPDKVQANDKRAGVDLLVAALASPRVVARRNARHTLETIGERAVPSLIRALGAEDVQMRWEAAKALVDIASPRAAPALVATLRDREGGIRWLAAEALIALGPAALEPVLHGLIDFPSSAAMHAGAHHVLHELVPGPLAELVLPVQIALEGPTPEDNAPVAAYEALEALKEGRWDEAIKQATTYNAKARSHRRIR